MFVDLLETLVGATDDELDERLRENELRLRALMAERAAVLAVVEHRGSFAADGHRSMAAYLRATCNTSGATTLRDRRLASLLAEHPTVGDALAAGHLSVDHALALTTIHRNPRISPLLAVVLDVFLELAEHSSFREFESQVDQFVQATDQDGAFADLAAAVDGRTASVVEVGGTLDMTVRGGDPLQATQVVAVFDRFVDAEYRRDLDARRAEWGDDADAHPLPRTPSQRRFDALIAIFAAAAGSPEGGALPEPTVHIVVDERSAHEALTHAGITLPGGNVIELDDDGGAADPDALLADLADELLADPAAFLRRRCHTEQGSPVHPSIVLRALLTGHVRRVVLDSQGVVVDYGTRQRLFTGLARAAALAIARTCDHPGCDLPARWSQIDHNVEWSDGGRTDQRNANIECGHHNRFKHRRRWRTRRDPSGRTYTVRDDGTIVLPVGERPPDLTVDELTEIIRSRLRADLAARVPAGS